MNRIRLHARIVEHSALRYTPGGIPVAELTLQHQSAVVEAGSERQLDFECAAVALGPVAQTLSRMALGSNLEIDGFIAPVSRRGQRLRIHITSYREISGV